MESAGSDARRTAPSGRPGRLQGHALPVQPDRMLVDGSSVRLEPGRLARAAPPRRCPPRPLARHSPQASGPPPRGLPEPSGSSGAAVTVGLRSNQSPVRLWRPFDDAHPACASQALFRSRSSARGGVARAADANPTNSADAVCAVPCGKSGLDLYFSCHAADLLLRSPGYANHCPDGRTSALSRIGPMPATSPVPWNLSLPEPRTCRTTNFRKSEAMLLLA